jgi:trk system potassium uptake protein TrkA
LAIKARLLPRKILSITIAETNADTIPRSVRTKSPIINIPLTELGPKLKNGVLVAAILRESEVIIPHGQDFIKPGDAVVIVSKLLGINDISDIIR